MCALGKELDAGPAELVRLGFSIVEPSTHIRPHYGPSNDQLKAHLGLIIPVHWSGESPSSSLAEPLPCAEFTVGGEKRGWTEGRAILFDDSFLHEVFMLAVCWLCAGCVLDDVLAVLAVRPLCAGGVLTALAAW